MTLLHVSLRRVVVVLVAIVGAAVIAAGASSALVETAAGHSVALTTNYVALSAVPGLDVPVQLTVPSPLDKHRPARVLVVLHGMGGNGPAIAAPFIESAVAHGWVVVAPTFVYGDWRDVNEVRKDDAKVLPALKVVLDGLPARVGAPVETRVLVYGFSRGAQVAHRFAFFYPERVSAVAAFSAGTYTVPMASLQDGSTDDLSFPYGVADLERYTGESFRPESLRNVHFLIGVGRDDNSPADVPRSWDRLIGSCRSDRAAAFTAALQEEGIPAQLQQFAQAKHEQTAEMHAAAIAFLADVADGSTSPYDLP